MKLKTYIDHLNKMVIENPNILNFELIYSHDDEGNEFQKVFNLPEIAIVENINEDRYLNLLPKGNENAIIIN